MKKILLSLVAVLSAAIAFVGLPACAADENSTAINVYAPDGAPALALAELMYKNEDFDEGVSYHIVANTTLSSRVTAEDESKNADIIIMPINMASKLLNDGSRYKMLGSVTHGNLYILANKNTPELTSGNFAQNIEGKTIGVVNANEFPGVMFKTLLSEYTVQNAQVMQVNVPQIVGTDTTYDYFVAAEPGVSKIVGTPENEIKIVGDIQELYGEGGYPQAVVMAKTSLIEGKGEFVAKFMDKLTSANSWLMSGDATSDMILNAIKRHYPDPENTKPSFDNLTKETISRCAVDFRYSSACASVVKKLLTEFKNVNPQFAQEVGDEFFYSAQI